MKLTSLKVGKKIAKVKSETTRVYTNIPRYEIIHSDLARMLGYDIPKGYNGIVKVDINLKT